MNGAIAHIVYASDEKFAEILGVSLTSLYENSQDMEDIMVYILDDGISEEDKEKIVKVSSLYRRSKPVWIKAKNICEELAMEVEVDRGSLTQYARLFISADLPKELERILYLDCDTIINHSISELWNLDLHDKTIAALGDAFSKYYRMNIDLEPDDVMFNSGVMLIDLKKWKENAVEEKLRDFIKKRHGQIQQGDQGALNAVLSRDTYCFDPRFNSVSIFYDFSYEEMLLYRKPPCFYSKEEVQKAIDDPVIIHFTTSFMSKRAWVCGCNHRYVSKWMQYKEKSLWKEKELWKDYRPNWKLYGAKVIERLPRKIGISLAGIMQIYVRPFRYKMRFSSFRIHIG